MAITPSTQGTTLGARTPINVKRLAMWKISYKWFQLSTSGCCKKSR